MSKYIRMAAVLLTAAVSITFGALGASAAETAGETPSAAVLQTEECAEGWVACQGKFYYVLPDGTYATGETEIDGFPYLFGYSGALKTDWQTVGGNRYYYDPATGTPVFGWVDYFGMQYYVTEEEGKLTGFREIGEDSYYFGTDGTLRRGAFAVDGTLYCSNPDTGILSAGLQYTDAGIYCTDADGVTLSGWQTVNGLRYYLDETTHLAHTGQFMTLDGVTYYFGEDGVMATGFLTATDGKLYCFDETGAMYCSGWTVLDGKTYYFNTNGTAKRGFTTISGNTYYFNGSGVMQTGLRTIKDNLYYFAENGVMQTGWIETDGNTYYMLPEGMAVTGWHTVDKQSYYFYETGIMAASVTLTIDGFNCTFDADGKLISKTTPAITLDVPDYKQFDEQWGSVALGSTTIKSSGCLVTAMAMLHSYTTNSAVTPVTMKNMLTFTSGGALAYWSEISALGYTVETYDSCAVSEDILRCIYNQLSAGKPVVMGAKNSSNGQHYVTIVGYTGDGTSFSADQFLMNDPGSSYRYLLSEYLALFPKLYKLIY